MPRKVFVAGEILTAADVNTNLMDQAVMSFAGTAARGSAIPTPTEGMVAYLNDSNLVSIYDGSEWQNSLAPGGGILQVVQAVKTDTFTTNSTSFTTVTGLSASITPKSTTSKIMVFSQITHGLGNNSAYGFFKVTRGGTDIYRGDAGGSNRVRAVFGGYSTADMKEATLSGSIMYLDSPATTSSVTYQVEARVGVAGTVTVNLSPEDAAVDNANRGRGASSITLLEVAA